ncbi:hypothetical protein [Jutongia sp.]|uniref:BtrH N-terminal domain-containing protein n=1 Tax=Jutongia sp. TaxID=2944204 RepID=UPI003078E378|nr:hypothetical protein [Clostridiales bacterium]
MELKNYRTIQGYECLNSCVVNLLQNEGYPVNLYDVLIIGDGLDIIYSQQKGFPEIQTSIYGANFRYMDKIGISYSCKKYCNKNLGEFLKKQFSENRRMILRVDAQKLIYNKAFHQEASIPHFVNLIGISDNLDLVKIGDGCAPAYQDCIFEDWIDIEEIEYAWSEMGHEYIEFDLKDSQNWKIAKYKTRDVFSDYKKKNKLRLANRLFRKNIYAIEFFRKEIIRSVRQNEEFFDGEIAYYICQSIKINGILPLKKILYQYYLNVEKDEYFIEKCKTQVELWEQLSFLLIKVLVSRREDVIQKIEEILSEIVKVENDYAKAVAI